MELYNKQKNEIKQKIDLISEELLSIGLSPIFFNFYPNCLFELFNEVKIHIISTGVKYNSALPDLNTHASILAIDEKMYDVYLKTFVNKDSFYDRIYNISEEIYNRIIQDKSWGLISTADLIKYRQWYQFNNFEIHISPVIQERLYENFDLTEMLNISNNVYIRPNPFRIKPINSSREFIKKEFVYGVKFNWDRIKNLKSESICEYQPTRDPDNGKYEKGHTTQFLCELKENNIVQFSCEELPSINDYPKENIHYSTRFIHALYDTSSSCITHFDGAVHIYEKSEYERRLSQNLRKHNKAYTKAKIFLIDEKINQELFESISQTFFNGNDMLKQYFSDGN